MAEIRVRGTRVPPMGDPSWAAQADPVVLQLRGGPLTTRQVLRTERTRHAVAWAETRGFVRWDRDRRVWTVTEHGATRLPTSCD